MKVQTDYYTLTHLAVTVEQSELKRWQLERQTKGASKLVTRFFDLMEDAENWLASKGYRMIPPAIKD